MQSSKAVHQLRLECWGLLDLVTNQFGSRSWSCAAYGRFFFVSLTKLSPPASRSNLAEDQDSSLSLIALLSFLYSTFYRSQAQPVCHWAYLGEDCSLGQGRSRVGQWGWRSLGPFIVLCLSSSHITPNKPQVPLRWEK